MDENIESLINTYCKMRWNLPYILPPENSDLHGYTTQGVDVILHYWQISAHFRKLGINSDGAWEIYQYQVGFYKPKIQD